MVGAGGPFVFFEQDDLKNPSASAALLHEKAEEAERSHNNSYILSKPQSSSHRELSKVLIHAAQGPHTTAPTAVKAKLRHVLTEIASRPQRAFPAPGLLSEGARHPSATR